MKAPKSTGRLYVLLAVSSTIMYLTPNETCLTAPNDFKSRMIFFIGLIGIARPIFSTPLTARVVIPITSPLRLINGPPELPGLIAASV